MVIYFLARIHLATLSAIRSDSQVRAAVIHYRSQASPSNGFDHLENIIRTEAFTTVILKVCDDWKILPCNSLALEKHTQSVPHSNPLPM